MLKLNASYSKKVPAEGDYTSQSYHASIEVELPDGLNPQQLQERIHDTFAMVRDSVEAELHGTGTAPQSLPQQAPQSQPSAPIVQTPCATAPVQPNGYAQPPAAPRAQGNYQQPPRNRPYGGSQRSQRQGAVRAASPKQLDYLLNLVTRTGSSVEQILQRCQVGSIEQLSSQLCSQLIQELSAQAA